MSRITKTSAPNDSKDELTYISVSEIQPNRHQPRREFNEQTLEELAESIENNGLVQPISVRRIDDGEEGINYEIIAGERRFRAVKNILGKPRIRAIIKHNYTDTISATNALIENIQRDDLNPLEEGEAIANLMKNNNYTQEQAAKHLHKSRSYVSNMVRLEKLAPTPKQLIAEGKLNKWLAMTLVGAPKEIQGELAKKAVKQEWSVDTLRKRVQAIKNEGKKDSDEEEKDSKSAPNIQTEELSGHLVLVKAPSLGEMNSLIKELNAKKEEGWINWRGKATIEKLFQRAEEKTTVEEHESTVVTIPRRRTRIRRDVNKEE